MWYIDARKYDPRRYDKRVDELLYNEEVADQDMFSDHRTLIEARMHGNPFVDAGMIAWMPNTEAKRSENDAYRAELDGEGPSLNSQEYFEKVVPATVHVQGSFYIIDVDDPELAEGGEEYIHERLTSHLADPYATPESSWEPWMAGAFSYMSGILVNNLANGFMPAPIILEPFRQRLGFPYEWVGAPID